MPTKLVLQQRGASGLNTAAELPTLENGKVNIGLLPVVGAMGSAIIERGDNANGEYIRWADGTQVCYANKSIAIGKLDVWTQYNHTFPAAFISVPTAFADIGLGASASKFVTCKHGDCDNTGIIFNIQTTSAGYVNAPVNAYIFAIGRWK